MSGPTRDEWLQALAAVMPTAPPDTDAITIQEFMGIVGMKKDGARQRMKALVDAGRAQATTKIVRTATGHWRTVPAYRLIQEDPCLSTSGGSKTPSTGQT